MSDYLPDVYVRFRERYPGVAQSLDVLGEATQGAGGLDARSQRLVKLGSRLARSRRARFGRTPARRGRSV